ncbi:MAG: magnesium transporter [Rubritalea sp.]|jgi:magnesium transporter|tara:strand:- start:27602 stop:28987 length:1386 start_codon:yes stop_codon:yes gene_type:complete
MQEEKKVINGLLEALKSQDEESFLHIAAGLHYADLAEVFESLNEADREFFTDKIDAEMFAAVITELPDTMVEEALGKFSADDQREILDLMSDDDRVDLLQDVSDETRDTLLELLEPDDIEVTRSLLRYGEDTAGGRMTMSFGKIGLELTVKEALDELRDAHADSETLARVYVTDEGGRLIGRLRIRDLAFNNWNTPIKEIYLPCKRTILASADQEEAAKMFSKYDLIVLPVIDEHDRLLGVITYDDALEIIEEESTEDIERMAGMAGEVSERSYLNTTLSTHFKRRFPWLLGLAFLAIASGYVMLKFEYVLDELFILALFLPMVVAAGGNTGGQASTMVIRAMALGELDEGSTAKVAWKELRLGLLLGSLLGVCIAITTMFVLPFFYSDMPAEVGFVKFGIAVAIAMTAQITTSTLVGSLLPIGARRANIDPAVVAAPAITTIVDVSGMVIYFFVAKVVML